MYITPHVTDTGSPAGGRHRDGRRRHRPAERPGDARTADVPDVAVRHRWRCVATPGHHRCLRCSRRGATRQVHYADVRTMPMSVQAPLPGTACSPRLSAQSRAFEEGQESVRRAVAARADARRGGSRQRAFLQGEVGVDEDVGRVEGFLSQPERDDGWCRRRRAAVALRRCGAAGAG